MGTRWLVWVGIAVFFALVAGYVALHFIPMQARFALADYERVRLGMTVEEVVAVLGPMVPDDQSLTGKSRDPHPGWKAWGDKVEQLHVYFDADGRVEMWVVQPIRPTLIYHVRDWLGR